ncbi:hypothetical protein VOLCADRAFT_97121 [Volvox carteri f. nagariensis]|uniref:Uncharacterized protein n=1 Tax=Volvox carteri f. nagariensis TaxID=3068 RepID=D8UBY1_VOLCA|nr:uncharacterized protein VOLCADRAFT_97121 [Volvox carteri f. nagariensis]EFJ42698.1 hypothetical protein VOLCADRAFT_97121 [Volvox carteri f. nagariensis]|eukprot:XP_002956159.1 hypothetical protein VOLCADRAFT_97121 [Volvox carteri f. nagariensis]
MSRSDLMPSKRGPSGPREVEGGEVVTGLKQNERVLGIRWVPALIGKFTIQLVMEQMVPMRALRNSQVREDSLSTRIGSPDVKAFETPSSQLGLAHFLALESGQQQPWHSPGLPWDFKRSEEYKVWHAAIKSEHPQLPDYLIDIAIATYRSADPKWIKELVRQAKKEEHAAGGKAPPRAAPTSTTVDDAGDWRDGMHFLDLPEWLVGDTSEWQIAIESFIVSVNTVPTNSIYFIESNTLTQGNSYSTLTKSAGYQLMPTVGSVFTRIIPSNLLGIRVGSASILHGSLHNFRLVGIDGNLIPPDVFGAGITPIWMMTLIAYPVPSGDFWVTLPHAAIKLDCTRGRIKVSVVSAVVNRSWYSVTAANSAFAVFDGSSTANLTLPEGYYDVNSLHTTLAVLLPGWGVTYLRLTNKFRFQPPADGKTYRFSFPGYMYELLGFQRGSQPTGTSANPLVSQHPVKLNRENTLCVHASLPKEWGAVVDNLATSGFVEGHVLVSIPIDAAPFDNITFAANESDMYTYALSAQHLDEICFWVTDDTGRTLEPQYDWCMMLRVIYTEGDDALDTLSGSRALGSVGGAIRKVAEFSAPVVCKVAQFARPVANAVSGITLAAGQPEIALLAKGVSKTADWVSGAAPKAEAVLEKASAIGTRMQGAGSTLMARLPRKPDSVMPQRLEKLQLYDCILSRGRSEVSARRAGHREKAVVPQ